MFAVARRLGAVLIGLAGIGVAFYQWWRSDKVAMRAMRAREVTPEEAPELHGMIDRLCALADMPKPRVGDRRHSTCPTRSPPAARPTRRGLRDHRHPAACSTAEELEGVLAHELSHVAHRDVLVMTVASSAGIVAGMLTRGAQFGGCSAVGRDNNNGGLPSWLVALVVSLVVYAISFFLLRLLSRYRELCADRAGRLPDDEPGGAGLGAAEDQRRDRRDPAARPARGEAMNAFFIAPAISGVTLQDPDRRPTRRSSSGSSSWPGSRPSSAGRA